MMSIDRMRSLELAGRQSHAGFTMAQTWTPISLQLTTFCSTMA